MFAFPKRVDKATSLLEVKTHDKEQTTDSVNILDAFDKKSLDLVEPNPANLNDEVVKEEMMYDTVAEQEAKIILDALTHPSGSKLEVDEILQKGLLFRFFHYFQIAVF